jgi:hypothetical protein
MEATSPVGRSRWDRITSTTHGSTGARRFVPYDFRAPTVARFKERLWAPENEHLITPQPFGVGWTVNVGRVVALVRKGTDRQE